MVVVAVAGGTGNVGKTLVEAIKAAGKHSVKIIARKPNPTVEADLGVPVLAVDYSDVQALTKTLEENNVHTLISAIATMPWDGTTPQEVELIHAANASKTTRRFVASDWGSPHKESHAALSPSAATKLKSRAELEKTTDLEWTAFHTGWFLDYWAIPQIKSNMTPITTVIDIPHHAAGIPGSGEVPVAFTHTTDVAKFVAASLHLEKWEHRSFIVGDKVTWNEFLRLAEQATGAKFDVTYDSIDVLKSGKITELPSHVGLYSFVPKEAFQGMISTFELWFEEGVFDFKSEKLLNAVFPEIKPWTVKDILQTAWGKGA